MDADSLESALALALDILIVHCEAGQKGYSEILLVDARSGESAPISTDEILWEYGEKRFERRGDLTRISFLLPPTYVYSLMPAMMRHFGVDDLETVLFFGFALLELYAHAIKSGICVVMYNPAEDSRLVISIPRVESPCDLRSWPTYSAGEVPGRNPSKS